MTDNQRLNPKDFVKERMGNLIGDGEDTETSGGVDAEPLLEDDDVDEEESPDSEIERRKETPPREKESSEEESSGEEEVSNFKKRERIRKKEIQNMRRLLLRIENPKEEGEISSDSDFEPNRREDNDDSSEDEENMKMFRVVSMSRNEIKAKISKMQKDEKCTEEQYNDFVSMSLFREVYRVEDENLRLAAGLVQKADEAAEKVGKVNVEIQKTNKEIDLTKREVEGVRELIGKGWQEAVMYSRAMATELALIVGIYCCAVCCFVTIAGVILCEAFLCSVICDRIPETGDACRRITGFYTLNSTIF